MYKHVFICDRCGIEVNTSNTDKGLSWPKDWFPFLDKHFCNKCVKIVSPQLDKVIKNNLKESKEK